jgi:hypothetical protein
MKTLTPPKQLANEAQKWNDFVRQHSRMHDATIWYKTMESIQFSRDVKAKSFAIPTKLVQLDKNLWRIARQYKGGYLRLESYIEEDNTISIFYPNSGIKMGEIQAKHKDWLLPLLLSENPPTFHLIGISGGTDGKNYGVNVAIGNIYQAILTQ